MATKSREIGTDLVLSATLRTTLDDVNDRLATAAGQVVAEYLKDGVQKLEIKVTEVRVVGKTTYWQVNYKGA